MSSADTSDRQTETRSYQKPALQPEMTVRQVATDYPACRDILIEYGEPTDRPGAFGHFQPLTHFAWDWQPSTRHIGACHDWDAVGIRLDARLRRVTNDREWFSCLT
jgi:hypothetical protein